VGFVGGSETLMGRRTKWTQSHPTLQNFNILTFILPLSVRVGDALGYSDEVMLFVPLRNKVFLASTIVSYISLSSGFMLQKDNRPLL
jgi:hypothetical protein